MVVPLRSNTDNAETAAHNMITLLFTIFSVAFHFQYAISFSILTRRAALMQHTCFVSPYAVRSAATGCIHNKERLQAHLEHLLVAHPAVYAQNLLCLLQAHLPSLCHILHALRCNARPLCICMTASSYPSSPQLIAMLLSKMAACPHKLLAAF